MTRALPVAALLALTLGACMQPLPGRRPVVQDGKPGIATKTVARKMDPNYLVAIDQTSCFVPDERYRRVRVGQRVLCDWKTGSLYAGRGGGEPGAAGGTPEAAAAGDRAAGRERVLGPGTTRPVPRRGH